MLVKLIVINKLEFYSIPFEHGLISRNTREGRGIKPMLGGEDARSQRFRRVGREDRDGCLGNDGAPVHFRADEVDCAT